MAAVRFTARVLPVSPDGSVLLLQEQDPAHPGEPYWSSIGGGCDEGEQLRTAAVRELHEETGIVSDVADLVGPVHQEVGSYSWNGVHHDADHTYFALALDRDEPVSFDLLEPEEVGNVLSAAWWSPDLLAAGETCRPVGLPEIVRSAVCAVQGAP